MNVLRNKAFTRIWLGNAISELGGSFGTFCNSLLIFTLTSSAMALGSMWLLYFLPSLVLQLFIGPYIDRWSRKWIMVIALWSRGFLFALLFLLFITDMLQVWHIYAVQLAVGLITPLYVPANQAILPSIIRKEQLATANGYVDGTNRLMMFIAPVTAGVVIEYIGIQSTMLFVWTFLVVSGFLLLPIHENRVHHPVRSTWLQQFTEGLQYFFKQKIIVWLGVFLAFVQFGVGVTMVINLPYITNELNGNTAEYGFFMAGFPLGYVLGSILVGKIKKGTRRQIMLGALTTGGATFIILGFSTSYLLAVITEVMGGIAMAVFNVQNLTLCQKLVPKHLMGKVFSVRLLIIRGAMPLGVLLGSVGSTLWGIRPLYILIGGIICIAALLGMLLPNFAFLDQPKLEKESSIS
ncbi:enterobactin exporter EntS [Oceanobacillus picturae]|uniref:Enterobactin exporter EntS n=1 Tax=Oceanobacillus picturae TaxID=171693 RepID=W9AGJ8_9BACI|nr:MFS transporter [Oceanobacillus picturae]CDO04568.1 enterobactin exporter EntS [Oceanobacillus picturae]